MKAWRWLVLLTPSVELMVVNRFADRWGSYLFHGGELPGLGLLILNLPIALALSLALGIWHLSDHAWPKRIYAGLLFGLGIATVSAGIAFAGCSLGLAGSF